MNKFFTKSIMLICLVGFFVLLSSTAMASVNHTQAEAVDWARGRADEKWNKDYDGVYGVQCVDLTKYYFDYLGLGSRKGSASDYAGFDIDGLTNIAYKSGFIPEPGDIAVWTVSAGSDVGHVGIVISADSSEMTVVDCRGWNRDIGSHVFAYYSSAKYSRTSDDYFYGVLRPDFKSPEVRGSYMNQGGDRVLPDGDYMIAAAGDVQYYLDISGGDMPAANGTNVQLYHTNSGVGDCDAWTIKYDSEGFYRISQYGQARSLDVQGADTLRGQNVQVYENNSSAAQQWKITKNGNFGYRVEARCSGYSLDIQNGDGALTAGMNVQQWSANETSAQRWVFIPYKPEHTLTEGRYVIVSAVNDSLELDISGDTGDIENGRNLQVWHDDSEDFYEEAKSQYNAFDVTYYGGGYYQLAQAASGKVVDVDSWVRTNGGNLQMWDNGKSIAQLWAITPQGDGYILRARCSGLAMDVDSSKGYVNGTNVQQWQYNGGKNQIWKFVPAEHTVSFNANGGENAPAAQTKYYKGKLVLSEQLPTRPDYDFLGWAVEPDAAAPKYQPGDVYDADADMALYAVWKRTYETLLVLPAALTEIEAEAFAGAAADAVVMPASVEVIGEGAFGDVVILGYAGSAAEAYAWDNGLTFVPLDDDWVLADEVPKGARVTGEKWTYTRTTVETTTSTASSMEGWEQEGFTWRRTGGGTHTYASYPSGFDTGHSLYGKYAKEAISSSASGNTKREVSASVTGYIYWHWTHNKYELSSGVYNVLIDDHYGWDAKGREFYNFRAFESTESLGHTDPNGTDGGDCFYWWGGNPEDGSWWWFRFNVNKQTYTDYEKLFTYKKTTVTQEESDSAVAEGDGISDVRHWVKYGF